ncbi:MAG TPA: FecR family protein [Candidatus Xenobia bacterium]|jgi:hypothetical protein
MRYASVGFAVLLAGALAPSWSSGAGVVMVTGVYGNVTVQHHGSTAPAKVHQVLQAGDVVATDDTGRAALLLSDGSVVKLQIDTKVQFAAGGLTVLDGEVFAKMQKQHHGPYRISLPHGHASVLGTELDVKVAHASREAETTSTLTVVSGKVGLAGDGAAHASREVQVAAGNQSILVLKAPEHVVSSALLIATPSAPVEVEVDPIVAWNLQVQAYSDAISKLHDQVEVIAADAKAHSGFLSQQLMDELNDSEALIQSLTPDDDFRSGHQDLLLAFQNYKVALTMTANPSLQEQAYGRADAAYRAADLSFRAYMAKNRERITQFTR